MKITLIGGFADGRRYIIPDNSIRHFQVADYGDKSVSDLSARLSRENLMGILHTYRNEVIRLNAVGADRKLINLWIHESLSLVQAVERLIERYPEEEKK